MELFHGSSTEFVDECVQDRIVKRLEDAFFSFYGHKVAPSEVHSWRNSLVRMANVVVAAKINDAGVLVEYQLPLSSQRLDCLFTGQDHEGTQHAVIVELKQWERCSEAEGESVVTWIGRGNRPLLHPSAKSNQYRLYLLGAHEAFHGDAAVNLSSCAYLHNYRIAPGDPLLAPRYAGFMRYAPVFGEGEVGKIGNYLFERLSHGRGAPILARVREAKYSPSRKLMLNAARVIRERSDYVLLDEQKVAFDRILARVDNAIASDHKSAFIISGGPGTGKSVIALNLVGELLRKKRRVHHATGSKAFTSTLWEVIGSQYKSFFHYFNDYKDKSEQQLDALVLDEAHRIRFSSNTWRTPKVKRTDRAQIDELLAVARVAVFFIDDRQFVKPDEIGSSKYIQRAAEEAGIPVERHELEVQFRCGGSSAFVSWIENTLALGETAHALWKGDENFDFRIMDTPDEVERLIRERVGAGATGRMVAGYCWPWSDPLPDKTLVDDIQIGAYKRPWNAKAAGPETPISSLWATQPGGINQVGCVYTVQGFEFDYAGVIFGKDLVWRKDKWIVQMEFSKDPLIRGAKDKMLDLKKQVYRVLLSRGMKGCYVSFLDAETQVYFRNRMQPRPSSDARINVSKDPDGP